MEDDITVEVVLHPDGFFFCQKAKSCCGRSISIHVKSEVVLIHDDFTFKYFLYILFNVVELWWELETMVWVQWNSSNYCYTYTY